MRFAFQFGRALFGFALDLYPHRAVFDLRQQVTCRLLEFRHDTFQRAVEFSPAFSFSLLKFKIQPGKLLRGRGAFFYQRPTLRFGFLSFPFDAPQIIDGIERRLPELLRRVCDYFVRDAKPACDFQT